MTRDEMAWIDYTQSKTLLCPLEDKAVIFITYDTIT